MSMKKPRRQRKPASPDWAAVALELEPDHAGRRQVLEHLLIGAAAEVDRLVALALVGELNAAGSRALTEARRLIARLCGTLTTGQTKRAATPGPQYADLPMFTDVEPVADDVDVNAQLEHAFESEVADDLE